MGIRLSPQYGLNPAIPLCFFCGEEKNQIILAGRLQGDVEAPKKKAWDYEPCEKCAEYMKQGVILVEVQDAKVGEDAPCRTGAFVVITEEGIRRMIKSPAFADEILAKRFAYVPTEAWTALGLPRANIEPTPSTQE